MPKQSEPYSADAVIEHIQRIQKAMPSRAWRLTIRRTNPGGLTAHQTTEVKAVFAGFDWEAGQIIVEPAKPLTELSPEQVEAIVASVRNGSSWHAYEREKKLRERIKELEARDAQWQSLLDAAIAAERERWQPDAERYRWLRQNERGQDGPWCMHLRPGFASPAHVTGRALDAAIDASRKGSTE